MNELNLSNLYGYQTMNDWYDWRDYKYSNIKLSPADASMASITVNDEMKELKHRMSEMQTEINNIRAENQMLRNSLKTYIKEMKEIINKKK